MKKICIALITCLVIFALHISPVFAAVDDSGLQVYELDPTKMKGMSSEIISEDTAFAQGCQNLFQTGFGLSTLHYSDGGPFTFGATTAVSLLRIVDISKTNSYFINALYKDGLYYINRTSDNFQVFPPSANNPAFVFGYSFFYSTFQECVISKYGAYTTAGAPITMPFFTLGNTANSATIWNNRLWVSVDLGSGVQRYRLYYSAAANYNDFTATATTGGVIDVPGYPYVVKIVGTNYGLYVIAREGIWLISGGTTPTTWTANKIIEWPNDLSQGGVCEYGGTVYLACDKGLYALGGANLQKISELPRPINVAALSVLHDRFVVVSKSTDTTPDGTQYYMDSTSECYVYDMADKAWFTASFNGGAYLNNYVGRFSSATAYTVYAAPPLQYSGSNTNALLPFKYYTNWMTLDGNGSNSKIIKRVEIETIGNGPTIEITLNAERADGTLVGTSKSYLDFKTVAPITSAGVPDGRPATNSYIWNVDVKQPFRKIYLGILSLAGGTLTGHLTIKKVRIYYQNLGNPLNNTLR